MLKKVLLNVLYNIAIFVMVLCLFWGIDKGKYSIAMASAFALALIIFLKLRLIKQVKDKTKQVKS